MTREEDLEDLKQRINALLHEEFSLALHRAYKSIEEEETRLRSREMPTRRSRINGLNIAGSPLYVLDVTDTLWHDAPIYDEGRHQISAEMRETTMDDMVDQTFAVAPNEEEEEDDGF